MNFTYTTDRFAAPIGATSIRLGGINWSQYGFVLTQMPDAFMPPTSERKLALDNRAGAIDMGSIDRERRFTVSGEVVGKTPEDREKKTSELIQALHQSQHYQSEWLVNQTSVTGIPFEIVGRTLWYSAGTISVTSGSPSVVGTGTKFTKYIKPGCLVQVAGDSTSYWVEHVGGDTALTLDKNFAGTTNASAAYRIERRRFLLVNYSGESSITPIGDQGFYAHAPVGASNYQGGASAAAVSIGLYACNPPYWLGEEFVHEESSLTANSFFELEGVGRMNLYPRIQIVGGAGAVSSPAVVSAKWGLTARYRGSMDAVITDGTTIAGSFISGAEAYSHTQAGIGVLVPSLDILRHISNILNYKATTIFVRFEKDSTAIGAERSIVDVYDAVGSRTDAFLLGVNASNQFYVDTRGASTTTENYLLTDAINVNAGDRVEVAFWFDENGGFDEKDGTTYYAKLFVNKLLKASATALPANRPTKILTTVELGQSGGNNGVGATFDMLGVANMALSDEEILTMATRGDQFQNTNTRIAFSMNVNNLDILELDPRGNAQFYDDSAVTLTNANDQKTGRHPIIRGDAREKQIVYLSTGLGATVEKARIIYSPMWA